MARKDANPGAEQTVAQRRLEVIQYRSAGMSERAIAQKLGVSQTTIHKDCQAVLREVREKTLASAEALQTLQFERLEMGLVAIAARVIKGDLSAIDRWVNLIKTQSELMGLNEPKKVAPTTPDGKSSWGVIDRKKVGDLMKKLPVDKLEILDELLGLLDQGSAGEADEGDDE